VGNIHIGKGSRWRDRSHLYPKHLKKNTPKNQKINKILSFGMQPIVIKIKDSLSEKVAFELEFKIINTIGRISLKNGPLLNLIDGGAGTADNLKTYYSTHEYSNTLNWTLINPSGKIFHIRNLNEFCRNNNLSHSHLISVALGKRPHHKGWKCQKEGNVGIVEKSKEIRWILTSTNGEVFRVWSLSAFAKEHNLNQSVLSRVANGLCQHHRGWSCQKIREAKSPIWIITSPNGKIFQEDNLTKFCQEHNLNIPSMSTVASGNQSHHKGWKCQKITPQTLNC
jgi:hypothetical protein